MAKKRKKAGKKKAARRKGTKKAKGHIPLKILERRQKKLTAIVKSRGGKVAK
jgi:hypothetical protein